jgi:hypothetical protein
MMSSAGLIVCGSLVASRRRGLHLHIWGTMESQPGKVAGMGAHPNGAAPGMGVAAVVFSVMAVALMVLGGGDGSYN